MTNWLLLAGVVVYWYVFGLAFVGIMHAKLIMEDGGELSLFWKAVLWPWAVVGLLMDILFNWTVGSLIYAELPRELTFTSRCKRHKRSVRWRGNVARWWCRQLEQIDPGHC